ncbi:ATP-binding protein [Chromatocurvus halotolerans]|nr:ATP-binding protein [Chromatocurvus halotolerans]
MTESDSRRADTERLRALIDRLHGTYADIRELVGNDTDTVFHRDSGTHYVLPEAQGALRELERQARHFASERAAILDALPAQIALVDVNGDILAVNHDWRDSSRSLLGDDSPSYLGDNYLTVCENATGDGAEGAREVASGLRAVLSGQMPRFTYEYPCHAPNSRRWFLVTITTLEPEAASGAVVMHFDISARVLAQERAEQWRMRLGSVIDEAQVGILVHRQFQPLLANRELARLLGCTSPGDIMALADCSVLFPADHTRGHSLRPADDESVELITLRQAPGRDSERLVERRTFSIPWDAAAAQVEMLTDVTQQRVVEARLRQSQKMEALGQLTGGVAHDFNNLLTVILGNAELLTEALVDAPELAGLAELIAKSADRGAQLTSRLLSFSRQQPLRPRPVSINGLICGMRDMLARVLGEPVEVGVNCDQDIPPALVDPGQLEDALLNLSLNARDAMPDGGDLTLETGVVDMDEDDVVGELSPGRYVTLTVTDTGSGMDAATLSRAFEPFFSTKDVGKGSGLGLSMIFGFVSQSGGHLTLNSEPGKGTCATLYLPCAPALSGQ